MIQNKLRNERTRLRREFHAAVPDIPTRHFICDDLLPDEVARNIFEAFPKNKTAFRRIESFREKKSTSKNLNQFPPILSHIIFALQDPSIVRLIEEITGIPDQEADPKLYAGGLSMMFKDDYLNPHIDNSHDSERRLYRTLNLLYYVTPNWRLESGGNLELWDGVVRNNLTLESKFNRLVVMETNKTSLHSVHKVASDGARCCVSNYYFSRHCRYDRDYFHVTEFHGRPEDRFGRARAMLDRFLRTGMRKLVPSGLSKKDIHGPAPAAR